jgi:DnaK suppressor protein
MSLTTDEIKNYKNALIEEKESLEEEIEDLEEDLDFGDDVDSGDEETDETEEYSNFVDVKRNLDNRLEDIKKAIERIENGIYGICEDCEKEIEEEVLEANPASTLCKECKKNI